MLQQQFYGRGELHQTERTVLDRFGRDIPGYVNAGNPMSSDNYVWFWSMNFEIAGTKLTILFPWISDWARNGGTISERHIALYTNGEYGDAVIEGIITRILASHNVWLQQERLRTLQEAP